jgi:hypothetical protein
MILSILLIVILLGLLYINYRSDLHISKKVLMLLVFVLVCHGCMNNIRFEMLQERFVNLQKKKEHFTNMRENLTVFSPNHGDGENLEDREHAEIRDDYQNITTTTTLPISDTGGSKGEHDSANTEFSQLLDTNDELNEVNSIMNANDSNSDGFYNVKSTHSRKKRESFNNEAQTFARSKSTKAKKEQDAAQSGSTIIKQEKGKGISSIFSPQIIIKEGDHDGVYFKKSESSPEVPITSNRRRKRDIKNYQEPEADLWADSHQYYDGHTTSRDPWNNAVDNWNKSMASTKNGQDKECGNYVDYDNLRKKPDPEYQKSSKIFYPGYSYLPPNNWDVPQKRAPICVNNNPDTTRLPIGIADHGTPINALEVDPTGRILATEEMVKHTNVGSILPKFNYSEQ